MKSVKRLVLICILFAILVLLFKNQFYRGLIKYETLGTREGYPYKSGKLTSRILSYRESKDSMDIEEVIMASLKITSKSLQFTSKDCEIDPNKVIETQKTNCIGYSAFFSTTCNLLLYANNNSKDWSAISQIGQLYLLGNNVHKHLNNSFYKDHDFAIIKNKTSGQVFAVDPSLYDYTRIDYVRFNSTQ